jgi:hypothetical protein
MNEIARGASDTVVGSVFAASTRLELLRHTMEAPG